MYGALLRGQFPSQTQSIETTGCATSRRVSRCRCEMNLKFCTADYDDYVTVASWILFSLQRQTLQSAGDPLNDTD